MYRVFSNQSPDSNSSDDKNLSVQELKFEKYQIMVLLIININQHKKKRKNIKFFGKFSKQPIRLKTKENLFVLNRYKNQLGDVSNKKTNVELSQKLMSIYKESDNQYRMKKCQLSNLQIQQYKKQIHNIKIITNPNTNIIGKNVNFQSSKYNSIKRKVWHTTKPQLTLFYLQKLPTTYNYQSTFSDYSQNNNTYYIGNCKLVFAQSYKTTQILNIHTLAYLTVIYACITQFIYQQQYNRFNTNQSCINNDIIGLIPIMYQQ
eukprot:TRINITY_DN2718_c0_g1_i8.p1 TRINITY_DN2718_c0_g1~~TRINITY_DN2718_c0_g1_i8.p1  ORF type:complete len:261 (+),score=-26.85 TRINITY_DN2718_c0_g1_i8:384-1166(+)